MIMSNTIAIGDPVSSASRLAHRAKLRGYSVIELRTFDSKSEYYSRNYDPRLFDGMVEYRGDDAMALHDLRHVEHILIGADSSVAIVERLNLFRGQLHNDPEKILARSDKVELALHLRAAGLPVAEQRYFRSTEARQALQYAKERGFPQKLQVIKPRASGGTNNVLLPTNEDEFLTKFDLVANALSLYARPNGGVLVMDYVSPAESVEYVVDAVSHDGTHFVTDVWTYQKEPLNGTPAMYRSMKLMSQESAAREIDFAFRMLDAAGHRQGASHIELWKTPHGHLPVEIGFRLPGLITQVAADATGLDQIDFTLDSALDPEAFHTRLKAHRLEPTNRAAAVVFIASRRAGTLAEDAPIDDVKALRSYHSSAFKAIRAGDPLVLTTDVATIGGWVALCHERTDVVEKDLEFLRSIEQRLTDVR